MERLEEIRKTLEASEKDPFTMVPYKDDVTYLLSLIDQYKRALEDITKVDEGSPVKTYQKMEDIARQALEKE